jgi:hypothetical protein
MEPPPAIDDRPAEWVDLGVIVARPAPGDVSSHPRPMERAAGLGARPPAKSDEDVVRTLRRELGVPTPSVPTPIVRRATSAPPLQTFECGTRTGRIAELVLGVLVAAVGVLIASLQKDASAVWWLVGALVAFGAGVSRLWEPYEVRIRPELVQLVAVADTTEFHPSGISRIVRFERPRGGGLDHFQLIHRGGSTTLHGEDIYYGLVTVSPAALVETQEYDPD